MLHSHHMSSTIIVQNSVKSETDKPSIYSPHLFLHSTHIYSVYNAVAVQLLSHLWLFATPWTAAHQPSLSFTISWSLLWFMSIELVMLYNYLILCCCCFFYLQSCPTSGSFPRSRLFTSGGQSISCVQLFATPSTIAHVLLCIQARILEWVQIRFSKGPS